MDFRASKNVARVQEGSDGGKPCLFITPAGADADKKGDRAMRFTFDPAANKLTWESGKGAVSDACYGHCTALCAEARAAGIEVIGA